MESLASTSCRRHAKFILGPKSKNRILTIKISMSVCPCVRVWRTLCLRVEPRRVGICTFLVTDGPKSGVLCVVLEKNHDTSRRASTPHFYTVFWYDPVVIATSLFARWWRTKLSTFQWNNWRQRSYIDKVTARRVSTSKLAIASSNFAGP